MISRRSFLSFLSAVPVIGPAMASASPAEEVLASGAIASGKIDTQIAEINTRYVSDVYVNEETCVLHVKYWCPQNRSKPHGILRIEEPHA